MKNAKNKNGGKKRPTFFSSQEYGLPSAPTPPFEAFNIARIQA
jgi:hypothetical protein